MIGFSVRDLAIGLVAGAALVLGVVMIERGTQPASPAVESHQALRANFAQTFGPSCRAKEQESATAGGRPLSDASISAYCDCVEGKIEAASTDTDLTAMDPVLASGNDLPPVYTDKIQAATAACAGVLK